MIEVLVQHLHCAGFPATDFGRVKIYHRSLPGFARAY